MNIIKGRGIVGGKARGQALVTTMPMNFTAAFTKPANMFFPGRRSVVMDRHHDLYKQNVRDKVLVFPAAIGSTYTGMVLMEVIRRGNGPAAMIVKEADSLLAAGAILANVWFEQPVPVVEYGSQDMFEQIACGDNVEVNGDTGEIRVTKKV